MAIPFAPYTLRYVRSGNRSLEDSVDRYSFTVGDFHPLLLAGLPGAPRKVRDPLNGNINRRPGQLARLEATAINPLSPTAALDAFKKRLTRKGNEFLADVDTEMRRAEERASASEPRVRVGVGLFLFEQPRARLGVSPPPSKRRRP